MCDLLIIKGIYCSIYVKINLYKLNVMSYGSEAIFFSIYLEYEVL